MFATRTRKARHYISANIVSSSTYNVGEADISCGAYRVEDISYPKDISCRKPKTKFRKLNNYVRALKLLPPVHGGRAGGWSIIEIC